MLNDPLLPGRGGSDVPPPPPSAGRGERRPSAPVRQKHPAMSARILALGISTAAVITITSNYTKAQKADEAAKAAAQAAADAAAKAAAEAAAQAQAAAAAAAAQAAADAAAAQAAADAATAQASTPAYQAPVVVTVPPAPASPGRTSNSPSTNQRSSGSN